MKTLRRNARTCITVILFMYFSRLSYSILDRCDIFLYNQICFSI
ncbi:hypothetical protein HMPREF9554_00928 [Treponema phagedenis F0421]|nr:hypothetical protein HMPREF9554_00928 [Treponema phagedenis F0421]